MKKVLLLNPPGKKLYIRDYYCSKVSQASYFNPPIDLLMISGRLSEMYSVEALDAIAGKMHDSECLQIIENNKYDIIVVMMGSVSWDEDVGFLQKTKNKLPDVKVISSGDIFLENGKERLEKTGLLDAVLLDFTNEDIIHYLEGNYEKIEHMIFKKNGEYIEKISDKIIKKKFQIPIPRHDLFITNKYSHPFSRRKPFSVLLTDFGCPFKCKFCIMSTLNYKYRDVSDVIKELDFMHSVGVKDFFCADQTFALNKERSSALLSEMIERNYDFSWFCFSRVDVVDEEILRLMKNAGCHTVIFGIESANENILKTYRKGYTREQIEYGINTASNIGIQTVGTFILGLPEETEETFTETLGFIKKLKLDFASFNVAVPRMGTELRKEAIEENIITSDMEIMDQSGSTVAMRTKTLSIDDIQKLKKRAVKEFYFRPGYLFSRVKKVRSLLELKNQVKNGIYLLRNFVEGYN